MKPLSNLKIFLKAYFLSVVKSGSSRTRFLLLLFASFAAHKTSSLFKVTGHAVPAARTYSPWQPSSSLLHRQHHYG